MGGRGERADLVVIVSRVAPGLGHTMQAVDRADFESRARGPIDIGHPPRRQGRAQQHPAECERQGQGAQEERHGGIESFDGTIPPGALPDKTADRRRRENDQSTLSAFAPIPEGYQGG